MSRFALNITARRKDLGMTVDQVVEELQRRGHAVEFSTVAGWFNGSRGKRWKVDELKSLLDILQTTLPAMTDGEGELVEQAVPAATAREMEGLSPEQQQLVYAMVKQMKGGAG